MIHSQRHLVDHITRHDLRTDNRLHVVGVVSNPRRFHSRYRLAREWVQRMAATKNVHLTVVETAFGDRHYEMAEICKQVGADFIPLRTESEIWIKESMMNIGVRHAIVKHNANYIAWVDADVEFRNEHWALETLHQLQHFHIVQPWQSAVNLGHSESISKTFNSVGFQVHRGISIVQDRPDGGDVQQPYPYPTGGKYTGDPRIFGHCGYAWACTRAFWENVGGLIDFAILGSADHHMALGCRGFYSHSVHSAMKGPFMDLCHAWQTRAMQLTHGIIGYVDGLLLHNFHGPMAKRNYVGRWEILIKHNFNPITDLMRDAQGLIQLVGKPALEHDVRTYNCNRLEDSIEEY
jgi:hypothetical protein